MILLGDGIISFDNTLGTLIWLVKAMSLWVVHITASNINETHEYSSNVLDADKRLPHVIGDARICWK